MRAMIRDFLLLCSIPILLFGCSGKSLQDQSADVEAQQTLTSGEGVTWESQKTISNSNFTELFGRFCGDATTWPCYGGQAGGGSYIRLRGASGFYNQLSAGNTAANRTLILPIDALPSGANTRLFNVNSSGQMALIDPAMFEPALTAASQAEAEAGTETALRSFSPLRIKQAIDALAAGGTGSNDAADILLVDAGTFFPTDNTEAALQYIMANLAPKVGAQLTGAVSLPPLAQTLEVEGVIVADEDGENGVELLENTVEKDFSGKGGMQLGPSGVSIHQPGTDPLYFDNIQRRNDPASAFNILSWNDFKFNGSNVLNDSGAGSVDEMWSSSKIAIELEALRVWASANFGGSGGGTGGSAFATLGAAPYSNVTCTASAYYGTDLYLCLDGYYTRKIATTAHSNVYTPSTLPSLNAASGYATSLQRLYVFAENSGTTADDLSTANATATVSTGIWSTRGVSFSTNGNKVTFPLATIGSSGTIMIAYTSLGQSGQCLDPTSDYAKWFSTSPGATDQWMLQRLNDTNIALLTSPTLATNMFVGTDLYSQVRHVLTLTWDDTANIVKVYLDGVLKDTETGAFAISISDTTMILGNREAGDREGMVEMEWYGQWSIIQPLAAIESLSANPYQLVTNPPRSW